MFILISFMISINISFVNKTTFIRSQSSTTISINVTITIFALTAGLAQLVFLYNFIYSMFHGKPAEQNPRKSNTLEWTAPIKHFHGNWEGEIPHVHRWAYDYSKPGYKEDFVPQNIPLKKGEKELQH